MAFGVIPFPWNVGVPLLAFEVWAVTDSSLLEGNQYDNTPGDIFGHSRELPRDG